MYTTPSSQRPSGLVIITHPYHPLCGQQVEIIRICRGDDPTLVVQYPDGLHGVIATSWTDYATPQGFDLPSTPPHLLDFGGLCRAVQLIDRLRREGRYPAVDDGDKTCPPDDKSYD